MPLSALFAPQIGLKPIGDLCRRQSTSLQAGIDARSAWSHEADYSRGLLRQHVLAVRDAVHRGESVSAALAATGDYFPPLVHELVSVGELSGNLDAIFGQLADHYENQLTLRRNFHHRHRVAGHRTRARRPVYRTGHLVHRHGARHHRQSEVRHSRPRAGG